MTILKDLHIISFILLLPFVFNAQDCVGPLNVKVVGATTNEPILINSDVNMVYCMGTSEGSVSLNISGGTPIYSCLWDYEDEISESLVGLPPGTYMVTVTDANGCTESQSMTVFVMDPLLDSLNLVRYDACGSCYMSDGTQSFFYYEEEYVGSVVDINTDRDIGMSTICADLEDEVTWCYNKPVLPRTWTFISDSLEQSTVRFFFTDEELRAFSDASGYSDNESFINAGCIHVEIYDLSLDDCEANFPIQTLNYGFTITKYDEENGVWSVEIPNIDDSKVILVGKDEVLPVDFLYFKGEKFETFNKLTWEVENEINVSKYEIEKSNNGIKFNNIGSVPFNYDNRGLYTYNDNESFIGSNYYRLRQLDKDGAFDLSHVVHLTRDREFDLQIIENPFSQILYLNITTNLDIKANISIFAVNGQQVFNREYDILAGNSDVNIDLSSLAAGNYILRFYDVTKNEIVTKKIVKI